MTARRAVPCWNAYLTDKYKEIAFKSPLQVNYNQPSGINWTWSIPIARVNMANLGIDITTVLSQTVRGGGIEVSELIINDKKNTDTSTEWHDCSEAFFENAFYLDLYLMDSFAKSEDYTSLLRCAKGALIGLARNKEILDGLDYLRGGRTTQLCNYINNPDYDYVQGNCSETYRSHLGLCSTLFVIKCIKENLQGEIAKETARNLINDPDVQRASPKVVAALKIALGELKPSPTSLDPKELPSSTKDICAHSQLPPAQGCRLVSSFCAETFGNATSSDPTSRRPVDSGLLYRPYGSREMTHTPWEYPSIGNNSSQALPLSLLRCQTSELNQDDTEDYAK